MGYFFNDDYNYMFEKIHPSRETVRMKIGGTIYEISTSCEGSETLSNKVLRLMKKEVSKDDK